MTTNIRTSLIVPALCMFLVSVVPTPKVAAQQADSARIAELERNVEALARELERMDLGDVVVDMDSGERGFGPAASRVYKIESGLSIGGYGEFLYENYAGKKQDGSASGKTDQFDALRAILYTGYKFNDRLLFNSEIEVEHAKEIYLEFAYVDYMLTDNVGMRAGMLLAPLGLTNELHEPPIFLGTERPLTENKIIPTTWRENGIGLFGETETTSWRVYTMNSLNGVKFSSSGLRGGRQKGAKAKAENFGIAARWDYIGTPGLLLGASMYTGNTGQGAELNGSEVGGRVTIWDLHMDYKVNGFDLRALWAHASVGDVAQLNQLNSFTGSAGIGEAMGGWFVQAGYDLLRTKQDTESAFIPYVRYERVNTHKAVASGYSASASKDLTATSIGFAWKPATQVVFKGDYQMHETGTNSGINQINFVVGWLY